jgi:cytochrome c biogenesis protein CcmG, thiol:disulfide interchange protein DsbE
MKSGARVLIPGLLLAAVLASGCGTEPPAAPGTRGGRVGQTLPEFQMNDRKGSTLTNADLEGKVALLDFWATWCGPCRMAGPVLQRLHEKYVDRGLTVLGVTVAEEGDPAAVRDRVAGYAAEHQYTYTFTTGGDALGAACGVKSLPTMILVDRQGVVRCVLVGFNDRREKELETALEPLLDEKTAGR